MTFCAEELFLIKMINTNTCNFVSDDAVAFLCVIRVELILLHRVTSSPGEWWWA